METPTTAEQATRTRDECIFLATLAEKADRYDDMVTYMTTVVTTTTTDLTIEERNLFAVAYKNVVGQLRFAWQHVAAAEQKEDPDRNPARYTCVNSYRSKVIESELSSVCASVLNLLDTHLLPSASSSDSKVYYLKMKADYYRYLAEFLIGDDRAKAADDAMLSYKAAQVIALDELAPTHPSRLGLSLNFAVFHYEILNSVEKACDLAKEAFEMAVSELDTLSGEFFKDSTLIMQLIRENVKRWTQEMEEKMNYDDA